MSVIELAEEVDRIALAAAFEAKAVRGCEWHPEITIYLGDPGADRHAYALATNRWKAGETASDREEVTAAVQDVFVSAADRTCPRCDCLKEL